MPVIQVESPNVTYSDEYIEAKYAYGITTVEERGDVIKARWI